MLFLFLLFIVFVIFTIRFYKFVFEKPPNSPPGVPRLPLWGSYWFFLFRNYTFPHKTSTYYTKKYKSKIISCYLGDFLTVIATDHNSIKEVLRRKEFNGRLTDAYIFKARFSGKKAGIFFTDGPDWLEQRRFALRQMRDFGFGRRFDQLEHGFAEEIRILLDTLQHGAINDEERSVIKEGKVLFPDILYPVSTNFIWAILSGERLPRADHQQLRDVCRSATIFQRSGDTAGGAILMTPWLRHFFHGFGLPGLVQGTAGMINFIKKHFNQHKSSYIEGESRGFMDKYIEKLKEIGDEFSNFTEEQLHSVATDFLFPSLTASPWTVTHLIKFMMHHPQVLSEVQNEIDSVIGRDRLINLSDRVNLPYTEATIREGMRAETLVPWSVTHKAMEQTELCGYTIPKDTVIVTDLWAMHNDPEFWGDPENFRPQRFLTKDGQLDKDNTLPFGAGGRLCAGETFARQFLFLIFATLVQNFNFEFIEGEPSALEDVLPGIITNPKEFWIKLVPRD